MFLVLLEVNFLIDIQNLAVNTHADISFAADMRENFLVLALLPTHYLCHNEKLRFIRQRFHLVDHLINGLLCDRLPAARTMRMSHARKEQAQVVIDLRYCAHRRARIVTRRFLINGDCRRKSVNIIDIRLIHLPEKLPSIRRQRLHIAPLSLCIDGIKGKRRLARTRKPRNNDQFIPGNLHVDVLEIMCPRTLDLYTHFHFDPSSRTIQCDDFLSR